MALKTSFTPLGGGKNDPYPKNYVVYNPSTTGTNPLAIKGDGYYKIEIVGGGGAGSGSVLNGASYYSACGGGSGAAFVGECFLKKGTYSVTLGGTAGASIIKNSSNTTLISAGGGTNGAMKNYALDRNGGYGGTISLASTTALPRRNVTVNTNGNNGHFTNAVNVSGSYAGGTSVYSSKGAGGSGIHTENGSIGYIKITYKSLK